MASQVLRRLSRAELLSVLRRNTGAPFHVILWDNRPIRLGEALGLLEGQPEDAYYYASREQVYSAPGLARR